MRTDPLEDTSLGNDVGGQAAASSAAAKVAHLSPRDKFFDLVHRFFDSDIFYSFKQSKVVVGATLVTFFLFLSALLAPIIAPYNPSDLASLDLFDSFLPPFFIEGSDPRYLLGTDEQGRDLFSAMLYGLRISLSVGFASVAFAALLGISLGLIAGYFGGIIDAVIMRVADVQLTFPAILIALLIDGVARALFPAAKHGGMAFFVLVLAIGLSYWVQFARTVRGSTLVEKNKEYVQAAKVIGITPFFIMLRHVLPNVTGPILVIATLNLALAIILEATLSFLGVGIPPTEPSLGTLIRIGNNFLFSGEWWIAIFPGVLLAVLVLAVNLMGDWLSDALNPRLR